MKLASAWSTLPRAEDAAEQAFAMLMGKLESPPSLMLVHSSCLLDNHALIRRLRELAPTVPIQGGTSALGVLTEDGVHSEDGRGMGILGVLDPEGAYGAGAIGISPDPEAAVVKVVDQALAEANRPGEVPAVVLLTSQAGNEEKVVRTIERHLGPNVPIIGGTSADNDMSGQWQQWANDTLCSDGISVAVLFPSADIGYSFHSGYEPTNHRGIATRAHDRCLLEIDGRPAAEVYNEWTDGLIRDMLDTGGSLVPTASFTPLGNPVGTVEGIPYFRLAYPVEALADGGLQLFTDVQEGGEIVLMRGTPNSLVSRPSRVAEAAMEASSFERNVTHGALMLFCTGCMLVVHDRLQETVDGLRHALRQAPFLCAFTLGEQGCFIGGENRHGNLMIAVLTMGPQRTQ